MPTKILIVLLTLVFINPVFAEENNLRTQFLEGNSRILGINLRSFNAQDLNGNEIIDINESSGNFLNAIERLDEIKEMGINTLHVLPITPVGKLKALGTAGSVYAISDFWHINLQLVDSTSEFTAKEQAKKFTDECHKRGIRVVIDLPSCGAYDLFLTHPELFIKDNKQCSIVPTDWTDVRLLNTGNDIKLNQDVLDAHKRFVDMVLEIGADGIRADVATIKPFMFWKEIISYAREFDPEFMFLAEASDSWREPPSKYAEFTPYDKLLEAGFDGYYGSFFSLKDWKNAEELYDHVKFNKKLLSSYSEPKNVILSFTTHDEVSPIVLHGENFSKMICWLEATLPFNPYSIDGFYNGDNYLYNWGNTKADYSSTDDDTYFVHRGKLDIFNFSRRPGSVNINECVRDNFKRAYEFRAKNQELISKGEFLPIKTNNDTVFAFLREYNAQKVYVIGNLDYKNNQKACIKIQKLNNKTIFDIINEEGKFKISGHKLNVDLKPGEVLVLKVVKEG